jgi:hypothetical protein
LSGQSSSKVDKTGARLPSGHEHCIREATGDARKVLLNPIRCQTAKGLSTSAGNHSTLTRTAPATNRASIFQLLAGIVHSPPSFAFFSLTVVFRNMANGKAPAAKKTRDTSKEGDKGVRRKPLTLIAFDKLDNRRARPKEREEVKAVKSRVVERGTEELGCFCGQLST